MKHDAITPEASEEALDLQQILERVGAVSARPRYTMLVLDLIARVAGEHGKAGPWIKDGEHVVTVREWLCDTLAPMAARNRKRLALVEQVKNELAATGRLPDDRDKASSMIEEEVRERARTSGLTAVSRAVTELVNAKLISRHYQGYRVDHENRGAQRHAVYSVPASVRAALSNPPHLLSQSA
jgi:hypothetical protein